MPRKPEPSFSLKQIIWDIAANADTDNFSAIYREVDEKLRQLHKKEELYQEETPDIRTLHRIIEIDINRLSPEVVVAKLPRYVWHLRSDYAAIKQLAAESIGAEQKPCEGTPHKQQKLELARWLVIEIYSPLYEEVSMMRENISAFKKYNYRRYGRPDYSAPIPADKIPGNIKESQIRTGKYELIPESLRQSLDDYYDKCCTGWNPLLDTWNLLRDLKEGRIRDVTTSDGGNKITVESSDGGRVESWSLVGKPDYARYEYIKGLDVSEIRGNLEAMRQDLDKLARGLLKDLQALILNVKDSSKNAKKC